MAAKLSHHGYGKSAVRLTKVTRRPDGHDLRELSVDIHLEGDFGASYMAGDNTKIVATDSMKNTVYVLARDHPLSDLEGFGLSVARHFLNEYKHISVARVKVCEHPWERIAAGGVPHPAAFLNRGAERHFCVVHARRDMTTVESGFDDVMILKTTNSAFTGYIQDRFTTLKETTDRVFATSLAACWTCQRHPADWNRIRALVRATLLETFARHKSLSVQQTLYDMAQAAMERIPELREIHLTMPNKHRLLVNLEPFGLDNPNVIFVPTDEPVGLIEARLTRE